MSIVETVKDQLSKLEPESISHFNGGEFAYFRPTEIAELVAEVERLNEEYAHTWTDERHKAEMAEVEAERDRYKAMLGSTAVLEVLVLKGENANRWRDRDDSYWLARLMQEVGELGSSLVGDHDDPPEHELRQIASIALNWLEKRAAGVVQPVVKDCGCGMGAECMRATEVRDEARDGIAFLRGKPV